MQLWWDTAPASLRATLWMLLADMPPDLPLLLFATADGPLSELDQVCFTRSLPTHHPAEDVALDTACQSIGLTSRQSTAFLACPLHLHSAFTASTATAFSSVFQCRITFERIMHLHKCMVQQGLLGPLGRCKGEVHCGPNLCAGARSPGERCHRQTIMFLQEPLVLFGTHTAVAHELSAPAAAERAAFFDGVTSKLALPPRPPLELRAAAAPPPKVSHELLLLLCLSRIHQHDAPSFFPMELKCVAANLMLGSFWVLCFAGTIECHAGSTGPTRTHHMA